MADRGCRPTRTNRLADLMPLVPDLLGTIATAKPGMVQVVGE
jgi:hypothetical protein